MKNELENAINHLYESLQVRRSITWHAVTDAEEAALVKRVKNTNRRRITAVDINYLFMNNCADVRSVKYFLPRALELLITEPRQINEFYVSAKVQAARFSEWSLPEQTAVIYFLKQLQLYIPNQDIEMILEEFNWMPNLNK